MPTSYSSASSKKDGLHPVGLAEMDAATLSLGAAFSCLDPNCGCVRCLEKCDRYAAAGGIPTNFSWWMVQDRFPVAMPVGETTPRYGVSR